MFSLIKKLNNFESIEEWNKWYDYFESRKNTIQKLQN